jgi:hypothetical protein
LLRIQQEKAIDPSFHNGIVCSGTALGEAVLVVKILGGGDGSGLPVEWMDSWFMKEQIPSAWNPITKYVWINSIQCRCGESQILRGFRANNC